MSVNLSPIGNGFQFFTNNGAPLVAGKLETFQAGSSTPLTTFTDASGLIANTNPIILGTDGRPPDTIWLSAGFFYKFVLSDANNVQIQVYDNLYGIIGVSPPAATPIPSGGILLWSGSIGSIPAGFVLCNGNNGTPDLRDRFLVGAGSTFAVDATGGFADSTIPTHTHTATSTSTVTDPQHNHLSNVVDDVNTAFFDPVAYSPGGTGGLVQGVGEARNFTSRTTDSATSITVSTSTTNANAGTSGVGTNRPPFYALAYIMKT